MTLPPSTFIVWPVIRGTFTGEEERVVRSLSGRAIRPRGMPSAGGLPGPLFPFKADCSSRNISVSIIPGAMAFTRFCLGQSDGCRAVMEMTAALLAA